MKIDVKVVTGAVVVLVGLGVAGGIALTGNGSHPGRNQVVRQVDQPVTVTSSVATSQGAASPAAVDPSPVSSSVAMSTPNVPAPSVTEPAPVATTPAPAPAGQESTSPRTMITDESGVRRAPAPGSHAPHPSDPNQEIPGPRGSSSP